MEPLTDRVQEIVATLTTDPERQHYVNYTRTSSGENLYVGPYPYTVANLVKGYIKYCDCYTYPTCTLKPRKGYRKTAGPTNKEIEEVVTEWLKRDLEVYARVLDWIEQSSEGGSNDTGRDTDMATPMPGVRREQVEPRPAGG